MSNCLKNETFHKIWMIENKLFISKFYVRSVFFFLNIRSNLTEHGPNEHKKVVRMNTTEHEHVRVKH